MITVDTTLWKFRLAMQMIAFFVAITACFSPAGEARADDQTSRVIVIGEVSSAIESVTRLLKKVEVVDDDGHWIGGDTILIQVGDLIDGGVEVRTTLDLFMRLQDEASRAGGEVVVLLGNHEAMNILGELRDVNYLAFERFAGPDATSRQEGLYEEYVRLRQARAQATDTAFRVDDAHRQEWMAAHPTGWVEYVESMRPDGVYGAWLRNLPVARRIGDLLFIHAGISPQMEGMDVDLINRKAADEISGFDADRAFMVESGLCLPTSSAREMVEIVEQEIAFVNSLEPSQRTRSNPRVARLLEIQDLTSWGSWSLLTDQGPLWFRGTSQWSEKEEGAKMAALLDAMRISTMVTGQSDGMEHKIRARFDGRVVLTSIDMSDDPWESGGEPAALEITDGAIAVVNLHGRELLGDR